MSVPRRQGRPEFTADEEQALARLTRDPDGMVLIKRLQRIKTHKQESAHRIKEYSDQMQHQGGIAEMIDLLRDFDDAEKAASTKPVTVNKQGRFG